LRIAGSATLGSLNPQSAIANPQLPDVGAGADGARLGVGGGVRARGARGGAGAAGVDAGAVFDQLAQLIGVRATLHGHVHRDEPLVVERGERLVEGLHAVLALAGLHHRVNLVDLVLADQVADGRVGDEDLQGHRAAPAVGARDERLAEYAFEDERELRANLRLLRGGEHVDDAVDGRGRGVRVEGGEGEVARLGDAERRLDGFEVAHFADEHHVRVLAQRRAQGVGEAARVGADLALVDDAGLVRVEELDGVLDGDDVLVPLAVDLVEHGGQRRRLAGPRGACDEDEAAGAVAEVRDDGREAEVVEGLDLVGDGAEDRADGPALVEEVGAEAREPPHAEGEVQLQVLLEAVLLRVGEHAVGERLGVGRRERAELFERAQVAVNPHLRRRVRRQVEVRAAQLDQLLQQVRERKLLLSLFLACHKPFPSVVRSVSFELGCYFCAAFESEAARSEAMNCSEAAATGAPNSTGAVVARL